MCASLKGFSSSSSVAGTRESKNWPTFVTNRKNVGLLTGRIRHLLTLPPSLLLAALRFVYTAAHNTLHSSLPCSVKDSIPSSTWAEFRWRILPSSDSWQDIISPTHAYPNRRRSLEHSWTYDPDVFPASQFACVPTCEIAPSPIDCECHTCVKIPLSGSLSWTCPSGPVRSWSSALSNVFSPVFYPIYKANSAGCHTRHVGCILSILSHRTPQAVRRALAHREAFKLNSTTQGWGWGWLRNQLRVHCAVAITGFIERSKFVSFTNDWQMIRKFRIITAALLATSEKRDMVNSITTHRLSKRGHIFHFLLAEWGQLVTSDKLSPPRDGIICVRWVWIAPLNWIGSRCFVIQWNFSWVALLHQPLPQTSTYSTPARTVHRDLHSPFVLSPALADFRPFTFNIHLPIGPLDPPCNRNKL